MEFVPAIDLIAGRCVRLRQGSFEDARVYDPSPLEMAKAFEKAGLRRLHLVDLDGSRQGKSQHLPVLQEIAKETSLCIDFSGGLRSLDDFEQALEAGASFLSVGSLAVESPEIFEQGIERFSAESFALSADARNGMICTRGWEEESEIELQSFISLWLSKGVRRIFCTDISRDGLLAGPSKELYANLLEKFKEIELTASGGVSSLDDLRELSALGLHAAIIGKAIYEGAIALDELGALRC